MADNRREGGCCLFLLWLGAVAIHLWITDIPVTSHAGFSDGVAHGLVTALTAMRRLFGAELAYKEYAAGVGYDLGWVVGVTLLLTLFDGWTEIWIDKAIRGWVDQDEVLILGVSALLAFVIGIPCLLVADTLSVPVGVDPPPLLGVIGGRESIQTFGGVVLVGSSLLGLVVVGFEGIGRRVRRRRY